MLFIIDLNLNFDRSVANSNAAAKRALNSVVKRRTGWLALTQHRAREGENVQLSAKKQNKTSDAQWQHTCKRAYTHTPTRRHTDTARRQQYQQKQTRSTQFDAAPHVNDRTKNAAGRASQQSAARTRAHCDLAGSPKERERAEYHSGRETARKWER